MKPHKWPFSLEKAMKIPWNHTASRFPRGGPSQSPSCLSCLRQQLHEIPMKQIIQNHPCSNQIRSPCFMLRFHSIATFHASIPFNRHASCFDSIQSPRFMLRFHSIATFHASIPFNRHVSCFDSIQSPCFMLRFHSIATFHASIPFNRHVSCFDSIQSPCFMLRFRSIAMFHASIPFNRHVSCLDRISITIKSPLPCHGGADCCSSLLRSVRSGWLRVRQPRGGGRT